MLPSDPRKINVAALGPPGGVGGLGACLGGGGIQPWTIAPMMAGNRKRSAQWRATRTGFLSFVFFIGVFPSRMQLECPVMPAASLYQLKLMKTPAKSNEQLRMTKIYIR
jgi:hypothetical protein